MGAMTSAMAIALLVSATPIETRAPADRARWRPIVTEVSTRFGVPPDWIERVIRAESGGLTTIGGRPIRSKAGAIGLMQIMPPTWAAMRTAYRLGADPDDPHDNIIAGTAFLRQMYDRFGYPGAIAAYNAGPTRYAAYLAGSARLPAETVAYLASVTGGRSAAAVTVATPPRQLLFALLHDLGGDERSTSDPETTDGLFALRRAVR